MVTNSKSKFTLRLYAIALRAGRHICHQKPERSFYWGFRKYPVCARCTGIYLAIPLGIGLALLLGINYLLMAILALPLMADGLIQLFTAYESTNIRRLITGILFGLAYGILIVGFFSCVGSLI